MNTIIIHRSIPRPCTSRDKYTEGLYKAVDVLLMPVWSLGYKPTPWWCKEGAWMNFIGTIPEESEEEEEEEEAVEADDGEFVLGEVDVEGEFGWAERMAREDEDELDNDKSIYSQDSFVEPGLEEQETEDASEPSPLDTRPTGEDLLKLVKFMTKAAQIGRGRRGRWASASA